MEQGALGDPQAAKISVGGLTDGIETVEWVKGWGKIVVQAYADQRGGGCIQVARVLLIFLGDMLLEK